MDALVKRGGAIFPKDVDLEQLLAKKSKMGDGAPKVRVVVGKNYGQNTDGTPKPIRAMLEERIYFLNVQLLKFEFLILTKLAVDLVGQYVESDRYLANRVLVNIDSYYSYEVYGADGSFRVFDSYVRAGREYDGHLPPSRVKMRHEVLVDTSSMTPYGVFTFTGKVLSTPTF